MVPREEYLSRIRAAHAARIRLQSDFVLIARTDALQALGYDECISRLRAARDEGADVGLLEGFASKSQAAQAVKDRKLSRVLCSISWIRRSGSFL